ncbi:MAG: DUF3426 domain-containing protein, partial [Paraburkholderia tropica]
LTLLDASNQVAARRVLAPADYVRPGTPVGAGLPAGATETMYVRIDSAPGAADGAPVLFSGADSVPAPRHLKRLARIETRVLAP